MLFKGKGSRCASRQLDRPVGWARQGGRLSDGRFGSLADIATRPNDVRFTPDSGYLLAPAECSVWCHKQTLAALIPPPRLWLSDWIAYLSRQACATSKPLLASFVIDVGRARRFKHRASLAWGAPSRAENRCTATARAAPA